MTEQATLSEFILSSLSSHLAVLDRHGAIVAINDSWSRFADDNSVESAPKVGVGANYLEACRLAGTRDAQDALDGIQSVLSGSKTSFEMQYACHSPTKKRWFSMIVTPMKTGGAIVVHTDVTTQVAAQKELEQALGEISRLKGRLEAESQYLRQEIKSQHNFEEIVGNSPALLATLEKVAQVADTNAAVLLHGETGTGKELLARAIHARGKRRKRPLIKVDCTTLATGLIESQLFGHEKGAFTGAHQSKNGRFELADGGTILLDEIGDLPLELQPKLLRVIQDGEFERLGGKEVRKVNVRVIAVTNRNLRAEMRAGRFRADLYYRLSVFPIQLPPLRERRDDIAQLTEFFLSQRSMALGKKVDRIPTETMDALVGYDWPGNIRELQNIIERAIILSPGRELVLAEALGPFEERTRASSGLLKQDLESVERQQIIDALHASNWKVKGEGNAASRLGLKPSTLRSRMKRLGIGRTVDAR